MKYRVLGKTGFEISEISLGTWQLGGKWGEPFNKDEALKTLETAYESGINFLDTADVYQGGLSEKVIGEFIKTKPRKMYVVTKCGRQLNPHVASGYTKESIIKFVEASCQNMGVPCLDLVLLHCPPSEVYENTEVFETLDQLKRDGKIAHYGVSVEKVEEAIKAMAYDISAVEIIFNMFRLKPSETFFKLAKEKNIGIIVRVPLASGLLTGNYNQKTTFTNQDHRTYNRNGEQFDKGETFSGVDYLTGVQAAHELKEKLATDALALKALKYILMFNEVSTVIPGASRASQIEENVKACELPDFTADEMKRVQDVYDQHIRPLVHELW